MSGFNQSIPLLKRPKFSEGTALSSKRDDRNNSFLWKKGELNDGQIYSVLLALQKLSREVAKQRRRIVGGGEAAAGWPWMYPDHIEGDSSQSYSAGYCMYLSALNPLVTTGMTDLVSGANATACQGVWLAMQNIPAAASSKWNVPQWPYPVSFGASAPSGTPLKGDLDNPGLYWYYLGDITS